MARQDIMGLLTGIGQSPIDPMGGQSLFDREVALQQRALKNLRAGIGSLTGGRVDARTTEEKAQDALAKLDPSKREDREKILQIVQRVNPERVPALKESFALRDEQEGAPGTKTESQRESFATYLETAYGKGFGDLARQGVITPQNMGNFIPASKAGSFRKGASSLGRDENQNIYQITTSFNNDTGEAKTVYAPYSPNAPKMPKGTVTPIATETGMTLGEELGLRAGAKGEGKAAEEFAAMKTGVAAEVADTNETLYIANNALKLLEAIDTGGFTTDVTKRITDLFGITPTSQSTFENYMGILMLQKLKLFGSNPTEGERETLKELEASINKSKGANRAILERAVRELLRKKERLQFLAQKSTTDYQMYNDFVVNQYKPDVELDGAAGADVLDFNNLPQN